MNYTDIDERPLKKRRFFCENGSERAQGSPSADDANDASTRRTQPFMRREAQDEVTEGDVVDGHSGFDIELFSSVVGHSVSEEVIQQIRRQAGDDVQQAVNIYLDGNWGTQSHTQPPTEVEDNNDVTTGSIDHHRASSEVQSSENDGELLSYCPPQRYVGAFGVAGWATRSGSHLLKHGELVKIERSRIQPATRIGRGGKIIARQSNPQGDVLTRFTNANGVEIGRLPQETAQWVSTLIDQKICTFEGMCVYAPDHIRINDTVYIQLKCYLLHDAFCKRSTPIAADDATTTRIFEQHETAEERALRLRQVALVTLFDEINLHPTSGDESVTKYKKEGLLRAADLDQQVAKGRGRGSPRDENESSDSEEGKKLEQDQLDTLYQKAQSFDFNSPEATPAESFIMELRKYQKQALHWMLGKEKDNSPRRQTSMHPLWEEYTWPVKDVDDRPLPRVRGQDKFYINPYSGELSLDFPIQEQNCLGGILADEMGLGKTIEMLSLIHSHRPEPDIAERHLKANPGLQDVAPGLLGRSTAFSKPVPAPHTTLVVAPTSLLSQWESEALKASAVGSMRVLIYYGNDKQVDLRNLCGTMSATNGPNLIITSYGVVRSEHGRVSSRSGRFDSNSGLFSVEFFRIILDEAHYIKNRASKTARACYELHGIHRWVLTGTPIVNRLEDLYSLVRFLKVEPWSNFSFWKTFITVPFESKNFARALDVVQTVLEPLVLRRTKTMKTPEGEALIPLPPRTINIEEVELSPKEREIYDVIFNRAKRTFNDNVAAGTLLKSYTTIFAQLLRLRQTCCHPILTRNQDIVADEEDAAIAADAANSLKDDMDLQDLIDQFTASLENTSEGDQDPTSKFTTHALKQIQNESTGECPICSEEPMVSPAVTACWHSACKSCLESYIRHQTDKGQTPRCFSCRETVTSRDIFEVVRHQIPLKSLPKRESSTGDPSPSSSPPPRISLRRINPLSPSAHTSAKIHALINHLTRLPPNTKAVVFSQFTSFLDLIGPQLSRVGIAYLRFDGTMPQKARAAVLAQFTSTDTFSDEDDDTDEPGAGPFHAKNTLSCKQCEPRPNVLLMSLRAGGVGLNLTAANHVFLMDPWWSFAVEAQAIDRVHRMGQLREVTVTRFVVKNSIEVRMLRIQERKMMIAGSLGLRVGGDTSEDDRRKERIEELKLLFE
ncbi:hypothetical protein VTO42DRAFT_1556 [Malbranchea cinnamomea]